LRDSLSGTLHYQKTKIKNWFLIAGGIGITPFRSMIKYLVDKNERRDIVLIFTASNQSDFVYRDVFQEAEERLGY